MIATPQLSEIPFDAIIWGGIGYAVARFAEADAKLSAGVLAIASLANHILFQIVNRSIGSKFKISSESVYTATNAVVSVSTILACQQLALMSRRMAGCFIFASVALLAGRLRILAS